MLRSGEVSRIVYRKNDPLTVRFPYSRRIISEQSGFFYKKRGGDVCGPFNSELEAHYELCVYKQILSIEKKLDMENLQLIFE